MKANSHSQCHELHHSLVVIVLLLASQWAATTTTIAMSTGGGGSGDGSSATTLSPVTALAASQSSSGGPTNRQDTQADPKDAETSLGSSMTKDDELVTGEEEGVGAASEDQKRQSNSAPISSEQLPALVSVLEAEARRGSLMGDQQQQQQQQKMASELLERASESLPAMMSSGSAVANVPSPVVVSPKFSSSARELAAKLPESLMDTYKQISVANMSDVLSGGGGGGNSDDISGLLPKKSSLFNSDAIDEEQLGVMDCHLRNIDLCIAGLLGSSMKLLPETNTELETRCDEMKATQTCLAVYNKRCQTFKIFSMLMPFAQVGAREDRSSLESGVIGRLAEQQRQQISSLGSEVKLSPEFESALLPSSRQRQLGAANGATGQVSVANLMQFCEPGAKKESVNQELRQRVFTLAKCINARVPKLMPCMDDFKTALQVFYEPKRTLPVKPTCCAMARFRSCASTALDNVCGLSSFDQLVESMSGSKSAPSSPLGMINSMDRVCRQATDHKSAYCTEVLPPSGMRAPQKRGQKGSKLSKALDLFSFSPAVQSADAL